MKDQNDQPTPTRRRLTRKAELILLAVVASVLVAGSGAYAVVQLTSTPVAGSSTVPTGVGVRPTSTSSPTATPTGTPTPTPTPTASASADESGTGGGTGGTGGGSTGGTGGSSDSGGGDVTPPPPPPPAPSYTDAEVRAAVLYWYPMAVPVYGLCTSSNYGTFSGSGGLGAPPPPVYVGILGYDAGALADGSGGWVNYYSCE